MKYKEIMCCLIISIGFILGCYILGISLANAVDNAGSNISDALRNQQIINFTGNE